MLRLRLTLDIEQTSNLDISAKKITDNPFCLFLAVSQIVPNPFRSASSLGSASKPVSRSTLSQDSSAATRSTCLTVRMPILYSADRAKVKELTKSVLFVCMLNNQIQVDISAVNARLAKLKTSVKQALVQIGTKMKRKLSWVSPIGMLPVLPDDHLLKTVELLKTCQEERGEILIYLGFNVISEPTGPEDKCIRVAASCFKENAADRIGCKKYACYFAKCRKTFEQVSCLVSHQRIHVRFPLLI